MYLAGGCIGFAAFGNDAEGNIFINYPHNLERKLSLVVSRVESTTLAGWLAGWLTIIDAVFYWTACTEQC